MIILTKIETRIIKKESIPGMFTEVSLNILSMLVWYILTKF